MIKYDCYFSLPGGSSMLVQRMMWCTKSDYESDFDAAVERYGNKVGASFLYKEEVKE